MQFIEFQNIFSKYIIFSLNDIRKLVPNFFRVQLDQWSKKGYIKKIKKEYYCLSNTEIDQNTLFFVANKIYSPSYISLEKALKFYGLIPEEIFQITSVSSKKTTSFYTVIGNFSYRSVSPKFFFGYNIIDDGKKKFLIAEPEKAILDYLYLNHKLKNIDDFFEMRINKTEFKKNINVKKFLKYLLLFNNKSLDSRANNLLNFIENDKS